MNIALLDYWSCPLSRLGVLNAGGMNVYVFNLANNLGKLGQNVDIYTKTHRSQDENEIELNKHVRLIHMKKSQRSMKQTIKNYADNCIEYINKYRLQYNLIHAHYYYSALIAKQVSRRLQIPYLTTFHTLAVTKNLYGGLKDKEREKWETEIVRDSNAIIASTELEKHDIEKYYYGDPGKIFVVSPGVNHKIFKNYSKLNSRKILHLPQSKKIILFVGRIDPIKGIDLLIKAVSDLTKKYSDFENKFRVLLIGGDIKARNFWKNKDVIKIKNLISSLNLDCCVKFLGSKAHNVLPYYYSSADIVVMPSHHESFGFVVLEAMACGSAIIASKVGGLKYLIKDDFNGRLFENGNIKSFANILWELVNDDKSRSILGKNALNTSQKYCWIEQTRKIIGVYKKII